MKMGTLHNPQAGGIHSADLEAGKGQRGAEIYNVLKQRIVDWGYPPGRRLIEDELCHEFGVSRVPVREALSMLEEKNLVQFRSIQRCIHDNLAQDTHHQDR